MTRRIGIVDYQRGNLRSVQKALEKAGADARLISTPAEFGSMDGLVLPGVGSFGDCAETLARTGLREPILEWLQSGKPYLGICLGYQLLFDSSEESPGTAGLGFLQGTVGRFSNAVGKVPHMGWNALEFTEPRDPLFAGLSAVDQAYFVHSYYPRPADERIVSTWCDYGGRFAAGIARGNVRGVQFHPEKSQAVGQKILRNFLALIQ
ncbi:MAG TPA: imidazole glycerol phosphate synthase subunit HisH [Chthoniobacterales bacterium]